MKQKLICEPPPIQRVFQHILDAIGHHDSKEIPVEDVYTIFKIAFDGEYKRTNYVLKLLDEYNGLCPNPILPKERKPNA
jgi:hypothetical protein